MTVGALSPGGCNSTSFPGSLLLGSKDPGRSWSREPPDFGGKLDLTSGRGSRGVCCVWKIATLCVIIPADKNVICNKRL